MYDFSLGLPILHRSQFLKIVVFLALSSGRVSLADDIVSSDKKDSTLSPSWLGVPLPQVTGAQFTLIRQDIPPFDSPYQGPLSVRPDVSSTYTAGFYLGWEPIKSSQFYLDFEKFTGAGVSDATGLASLTDGDAVRAGAHGLSHDFYTARAYWRQLISLSGGSHEVARSQDQVATQEADTHLEFKLGILAASDDFDHNRYANSTRTQFQNWSLFNNTAWDFAADTRGYTTGGMAAWISPVWSARLGIYKMPQYANGQPLAPIDQARGQNFELTWAQPRDNGIVVRTLIYQNVAGMGVYQQAIAIGQYTHTIPDIVANDHAGRRKYGAGLNVEVPLADAGETGFFSRLGWDDGRTESYAFTEMDSVFSAGFQVDGVHWMRSQDRLGIAYVAGGLSSWHRSYLEAGGQGFVLGDGRLNYGSEQVMEVYYRWQLGRYVQVSPDFQEIINPGFNRDRGPVSVFGARLHMEY